MSIRESLEEPLILNGVKDKEEREKIILDTLSQVGMAPMFLDRYPHQLSGGQRQRIIIARCLVVTPKIIFADEPISALDVSLQAQVINMLMDLQDKYKLSMLLIAHDLAVVRQIADQINYNSVTFCQITFTTNSKPTACHFSSLGIQIKFVSCFFKETFIHNGCFVVKVIPLSVFFYPACYFISFLVNKICLA